MCRNERPICPGPHLSRDLLRPRLTQFQSVSWELQTLKHVNDVSPPRVGRRVGMRLAADAFVETIHSLPQSHNRQKNQPHTWLYGLVYSARKMIQFFHLSHLISFKGNSVCHFHCVLELFSFERVTSISQGTKSKHLYGKIENQVLKTPKA